MRKLIGLSALLAVVGVSAISAPGASASTAQCAAISYENPVCAWSNSDTTGTFSWWPASSKGCHDHTENPKLRSFWNTSPYTVRLGGAGTLPSGYGIYTPENSPVTGEICWPA